MSSSATVPRLLSPHSLTDGPRSSESSQRRDSELATSKTFREVLACVDGSGLANGLVPHARVIAAALGARLTLLHVLESQAPGDAPPDPVEWGIRQREARAHLRRLESELGELESGVRSELIQGRAPEQICSWAEHHDVDLTVLCSHGARGITDWDLASTARKLIDGTPGSLLLIPAKAAARGEDVRYRRILVPLDGSPRAESVIPVAMRIAATQDAEVLFVHIVPVPEITRTGPLDADGAKLEREVIDHNQRVATAYLDRLRARVNPARGRLRVRVVRDGSVRRTLARLIREEEADLVIMSAHGKTGRLDAPFGSVTEYAVTHATAPLLVIRDRATRRMRIGTPVTRPRERPIAYDHPGS